MTKENRNILFIGSKSSGLELLKVLFSNISESNREIKISVLTFDDSSDIRSKLYEYKIFTSENNIPITIANNRKEADLYIRAISPDICFVMGWYWIFSEKILSSVPNGFIGIHYSLLPKNRGFSPLVWSIINGEEYSGFSIFSMNAQMDEGDIWLQKKISIGKDEYIGEIMDKFEYEVINSFSDLLPQILNGSAKPGPQEKTGASYLKKREPEDGKIDWQESAEKIYNFIRAQTDPYPGAFTFFANKKIIVTSAKLSQNISNDLPGIITEKTSEGVLVACGHKTSLLIQTIEINGRKYNSNNFFTSVNLKLG
ncbi:formyltransferase family protein [soil metagenome]